MKNAIETAAWRRLNFPEMYDCSIDIMNQVVKQRLLLYPSKASAVKDTKHILRQAIKLGNLQFSPDFKDALWYFATDYYASMIENSFTDLMAVLKKYCHLAGTTEKYEEFKTLLSSSRKILTERLKQELVNNREFYAKEKFGESLGYWHNKVTYKKKTLPETYGISRWIRNMFRKNTAWYADGLIQTLQEIEASYDYKVRYFLRNAEEIYFELVKEICASFVELDSPTHPYRVNKTLYQHFEDLISEEKCKKTA